MYACVREGGTHGIVCVCVVSGYILNSEIVWVGVVGEGGCYGETDRSVCACVCVLGGGGDVESDGY